MKKALYNFTGLKIERLGQSKHYFLLKQKKRQSAWFSYPSQLRTIIELNKIDVVLDVGANKGQFAKKINISKKTVFNSLLKSNNYCKQQFGDDSVGEKEELISIEIWIM